MACMASEKERTSGYTCGSYTVLATTPLTSSGGAYSAAMPTLPSSNNRVHRTDELNLSYVAIWFQWRLVSARETLWWKSYMLIRDLVPQWPRLPMWQLSR